MKKENYSQLELFSKIKGESEAKTYKPFTLFNYMRNYEKAVIIIISLIITGIISFSLGVERGKKIVNQKLNSYIDMATKIQPSVSNREISQLSNQNKPQPVLEKQEIAPPQKAKEETYAIQVASYQTKTLAQKEAEKLKKKGFSVLVITKGRYNVVYVGNLPDKKTAKSLLTELQKKYGDCFIRRL